MATHLHTFREFTGTLLLRVLMPLYILFGAVLKLWSASGEDLPRWIKAVGRDFTTTIEQGDAFLDSTLAIIITVELIAVGAMIGFGAVARWVAAGMMLIFATVLSIEIGYLMNEGGNFRQAAIQGDCGCFGEIASVPPLLMIIIDVILLVLVLALKPWRAPEGHEPRRLISRIPLNGRLVVMAIWTILAFTIAPRGPFQPEPLYGPHVPGRLNPLTWINKNFNETDLALYLDVDPSFYGGGKQIWIFYRASCGRCKQLFEEEFAEPPEDGVIVVAVEVPLSAEELRFLDGPPEELYCAGCEYTSLRAGEAYTITVPLIITIENEIITSFRDVMLEETGRTNAPY